MSVLYDIESSCMYAPNSIGLPVKCIFSLLFKNFQNLLHSFVIQHSIKRSETN